MFVPEVVLVEVWKEDDVFIIRAQNHNVTTQGDTFDGALKNFKEAFLLYIEDDDVQKQLEKERAAAHQFLSISIPRSVNDYGRSPTNNLWEGTPQNPC